MRILIWVLWCIGTVQSCPLEGAAKNGKILYFISTLFLLNVSTLAHINIDNTESVCTELVQRNWVYINTQWARFELAVSIGFNTYSHFKQL